MCSRLSLVALALAAALVGGVAALDVIGTASNQCDNMAGTCIRERQQLAILLVRTVCLLAAAVSFGLLVMALDGRPRRHRALVVVTLLACVAIGVAALVVQPVDHFNNRWDGWLRGA